MLIDCVKSPPADAMRAAGVTAVSRYLSWADQRDTYGKVIHLAEYDAVLAAGLRVLLNWEYAATDWLGGAAAGQAHAAEAVRQARALGYPAGCAIPGSADFNMTRAQWDTSCASYARAYSQGINAAGYVAGVYGPWDVLTWCRDLGGFGVFWQAGMSTSWSGGRNAQPWPGAHLRQRYQTFIGGVDCDVNDILIPDFGAAGGAMTPEEIDAVATAVAVKLGMDGAANLGVLCWRGDALEGGHDTVQGGLAAGHDMWLVQAVKALQNRPAVALTDADRAAIVAGVAAELGGKLDDLLTRLAAAGHALEA